MYIPPHSGVVHCGHCPPRRDHPVHHPGPHLDADGPPDGQHPLTDAAAAPSKEGSGANGLLY